MYWPYLFSDTEADQVQVLFVVETLEPHADHGTGGERRRWTVESLAEAAGMSRSAFAARFKEHQDHG